MDGRHASIASTHELLKQLSQIYTKNIKKKQLFIPMLVPDDYKKGASISGSVQSSDFDQTRKETPNYSDIVNQSLESFCVKSVTERKD